MKKFIFSLLAAVVLPLAASAQSIEDVLPKAQGGDVKAMYELAKLYTESWDDDADANAVKWYKKAADAGNSDAMLALYKAYYMGNLGLDEDEGVAEQWLNKAIAKGNGEALYTKGNKLYYEDGKAGLAMITKGAEAGYAEAQLFLAHFYSNSWVDEFNPAKAFTWVKKAAEQENGEAQYVLAGFYLKGVGTAADKAEALKWLKKAAENEHSMAAEILEWL